MTEREELQQTFNTVALHLLAQGRRSAERSSCLYRGPGGTKCAAGCLIPDEIYDPAIEHHNVEKLEKLLKPAVRPAYDAALGEWGSRKLQLVRRLQVVHDTAGIFEDGLQTFVVEDLKFKIRTVARDFQLSDEVLEDREGE